MLAHTPPSYHQRGFTLIELMVVVALIAIVSSIAAPYWRDTMIRADLRAAVNDFTSSLRRARSEAIKQNSPITICPSSDGATCTATTAYTAGWIIKTGTSANNTTDKVLADFPPRARITMTSGASVPSITFLPTGTPNSAFSGNTITAADLDTSVPSRTIAIAKTGRAAISN